MNDERQGLPSASKVSRYMACPGSWALEQDCTEFRTAEAIRWAESGDRIHGYLAGEVPAQELSEAELDIASRCTEQEARLLEKCELNDDKWIFREKRLWLKIGRKKQMSGKPDVIYVNGTVGMVNDYKSGYGDQEEADENEQIRTNIVLSADEHPSVDVWFGAIIQPLATNDPAIVRYDRADVAAAKERLLAMLEAIKKPDAPRRAGAQCRWCPAVLKCPEAKALLQVFGLIDQNADGEALAGYLVLARAAKPIIARLEAHAKALIKDGPGVPGWQLGKPQTMRIIKDPFAAFKALETANLIDRDLFLNKCISVGIGDLEKGVHEFKNRGGKFTHKAASEAINAHLVEHIEFKKKEAPLEQI